MESIILSLFIKYGIPLLVKEGVMLAEEATGIKTFADFVLWCRKLKTYSAPSDFPQQKDKFTPAPES
jgi:hypothetical protein